MSDSQETKVFQTADKTARTADGFENFAARLGLNNDNSLSASFYAFNLMTRNRIQLEAAYRGSWIVGRVIDTIAEDMTKAGIDITTNEADEDISDIQTKISRLQIWTSLCSLIKWGRLYGGAIAVIQIKGQALDTPFDIETVSEGQFIGLAVYDRWQLNPHLQSIIQEGPELGLPKYYDIVTTASSTEPTAPTATGLITVHHSRCIRNIGIELPFFQAITEMMWGESVLERLWDRLISFDATTMSAANLVERANNRTVGIENLREILAAGGQAQQGLERMFEMMRTFQTNEGLTLLDKNDTFASTSYSFGGLSDVMIQFSQQLSGAAETPLVRLFGQSPAGLNSTGDSDIRMYYDTINAKQEAGLRNGWDLLLKVLWRSTYGKSAPKDLEFTFVPLWQMSAIDKANIAKTNTETVLGAQEAGVVSMPTAMKELRDASGDNGLFSNITDEDINQAEEEELEDPPQPEIDPTTGQPKPPKTPVPSLDSKRFSAFVKIKKWVGL